MPSKQRATSSDPVFPDVLERLMVRLEDSNFGRCRKSWAIAADFIKSAVAANDMEKSPDPRKWQARTAHDDEDLAKKFFGKSMDPLERPRVALWHANMQLDRVFADELADEPWRIAIKRRVSKNRLILSRIEPPQV